MANNHSELVQENCSELHRLLQRTFDLVREGKLLSTAKSGADLIEFAKYITAIEMVLIKCKASNMPTRGAI